MRNYLLKKYNYKNRTVSHYIKGVNGWHPFTFYISKNLSKAVLTTFFITFLFAFPIQSQTYQSAVGARLGIPLSASYKRMFNENKALEGYIGTRGKDGYRWVTVSGAYLVHQPIDLADYEELYYYYGGGASIYFWSYQFEGNNQSATPGIQGYLGAEYLIPNYPVLVSIDWIPTIFISGHTAGLKAGYFTIGAKYILTQKDE